MPSFFSKFSQQPLMYVAILVGGAALCALLFVLLLLTSPAGSQGIHQGGNQPKDVQILSAEEKIQLINSLASSSVSSSTAAKKTRTSATTTLSAEEKKRIIESFNKQLEIIFPPAKREKMLEYIRSRMSSATIK